MLRTALASAALLIAAGAAFAAEPYGVWRRPEDGVTFSFFRCGAGLCVKVKNVVDAADRKYIGAMVFSGAQKIGPNAWQGQVKNLEDGRTYLGKITVNGPDSVTLDGCVLGGAICKGETWSRVK
ncbi:MAG: DUF2147 domain-containing protein [Hyphomicrobiales bacterium]|nr:DUF2147 domain-containing protein [Hyphomicrobiales bacterium]